MSGRLRLFAALELPGAARSELAGWGRAAAAADPALRALPAESLHVTLHFLGERPSGELDALRAAIAQAPREAVRLTSAGALWLAPGRPHVLTCALVADDALARLHAALGPGLGAELRRLRPHVTVARVRRGMRPRTGAEPPAPAFACSAPAVVLLRSHLGPGGSRYETLERAALRAGA